MVQINYKVLARDWELDPNKASEEFREAIAPNDRTKRPDILLEDFSLASLGKACLGHGVFDAIFDPRIPLTKSQFREAEEAVDSTGFSNITGQLIVNRIMQAFENEAFIGSRLVTTIPTKLNGEKIPGIGKLSDPNRDNADNLTVQEGMPYPHYGVGEDYIETPATTKRGLIVPVTREAIFFDRTGVLAMRCSQVGEVLGLAKEKRILDAISGLVNLYSWKGTTYQTYYSSTDAANWTNHLDYNCLVDWSDIDNDEVLFATTLDPNTREPVILSPQRILLTVPHLRMTAQRILGAMETRSGTGNIVIAGNPLSGLGIRLEVSSQLYRRLVAGGISAANAKNYWWYGDFARAFAYMENWPITVTERGGDSEAAFNQDIILRYKASERGAAAVLEPRAVIRNTCIESSSSSGE